MFFCRNTQFPLRFLSATTLPYKDGIPEMLEAFLPIATCQVIGSLKTDVRCRASVRWRLCSADVRSVKHLHTHTPKAAEATAATSSIRLTRLLSHLSYQFSSHRAVRSNPNNSGIVNKSPDKKWTHTSFVIKKVKMMLICQKCLFFL